MAWNSKVKLKHLMTDGESHEEVQANMNAIADVLDSSNEFISFPHSIIERMRNIPQGDDIFKPVDYANRLLDRMYDYANEYRIWIE